MRNMLIIFAFLWLLPISMKAQKYCCLEDSSVKIISEYSERGFRSNGIRYCKSFDGVKRVKLSMTVSEKSLVIDLYDYPYLDLPKRMRLSLQKSGDTWCLLTGLVSEKEFDEFMDKVLAQCVLK